MMMMITASYLSNHPPSFVNVSQTFV